MISSTHQRWLGLFVLLACMTNVWASDACPIYQIKGIKDEAITLQIETALKNKQKELKDGCLVDLQKQIETSTRPFGYFHPSHSKEDAQTLVVKLGPKMRYKRVTLTLKGDGQNDPDLKKLKRAALIETNDPFNTSSYEDALHAIEHNAENKGYLQASCSTSSLTLDPKTNLAYATIVLDTGPRYRIGTFKHNIKKLKDDLLRRLVRLPKNQPFSYSALTEAQERLSQSGYFKTIELKPLLEPGNSTVPIALDATLEKRFHEVVGLGFDTDLGWQIKSGLNIKWLNTYGHQVKIQGNLASQESIAAIHYIWPGNLPPNNYHQLSWHFQHSRAFNAGSNDTTKVSYQSVIKRWGLKFIPGIFAQQDVSRLNYNQSRYKTYLLYPQIEIKGHHNHKDLWVKHPFIIEWRILGLAAKNWPSQNTLFKASQKIQFKWFLTDDYRLALKEQLGYLSTGDMAYTPLSMQWALGGSQDLRGYAYQSIPGNEPPERTLKYLSIEAQRRITDPWFAFAFFDTGNVTHSLTDAWKRSAGIGVLWSSNLGDLALSLAHPLDDPDTNWRIHLNLSI